MRKIEPESIQEEEEIGGGSTKKSREKIYKWNIISNMIRIIIRFYSIQFYLITAKTLDVLGIG